MAEARHGAESVRYSVVTLLRGAEVDLAALAGFEEITEADVDVLE